MKKKTFIKLLCVLLLLASFMDFKSSMIYASASCNSLEVIEKNLETNIITKKTYSSSADGSISIEIDDTWRDDRNIGYDSNVALLNDDSLNEIRSIIGTDGRTVVNNTLIQPYSAIVYLDIHFGNDSFRGTGFLISNNVVVTAGHCFYDSEKGFATSIYVTPGRNGLLSAPFGVTAAENGVVAMRWYQYQDPNYDWAVFRVYGTLIGNHGFLNYSSVDDVTSAMTANICGYPKNVGASSITRYKQYEMSGLVNNYNNYRFSYTIDTSGGQSGAPILNESNAVIGIHTQGGSALNYGVKITNEMSNYFNTYIAENAGG